MSCEGTYSFSSSRFVMLLVIVTCNKKALLSAGARHACLSFLPFWFHLFKMHHAIIIM